MGGSSGGGSCNEDSYFRVDESKRVNNEAVAFGKAGLMDYGDGGD